MPLPRQADHSWWLEETLADDPGEPAPPLTGDHAADVVIVGGGYVGMWTAWQLLERAPGIRITILEQDICGGGPSGRNGGFTYGLWDDLPGLIDLFGAERGLDLCLKAEDSVEELRAWADDHGIDIWFRRGGNLGVSTSPAQDGAWDEQVRAVRAVGQAERFVPLTAEQVQSRCRSPIFREGVLAAQQATIQPARLARGLRRVLLERGVAIYEHSPVARFGAGRPAIAETPGGSVRAGTAVIAVNAWAAQWKRFRRTIMPRGTYILLTAPAPEQLEAIGWTGGEGVYDFRTALRYLRTTNDGRIAFGAASARAGMGTGLGPRMRYDEGSVAALIRDLHRMFPVFRDVPLDCAWGGPIDVTGLHLPFFGSMGATANVHYGLGFTGGGVGPSHLAGKILSGLALGADDEFTRLPLVGIEPKKFPPEPLLSPGAFLTQGAMVRKDEAEDEARKPNPLVDFVARLPRRFGYHLGP
jgi:glycine/D-amino acid oxidase-like deaminating enzyme